MQKMREIADRISVEAFDEMEDRTKEFRGEFRGQIKIYNLTVSRYYNEQDVPQRVDDFVAAIPMHDEKSQTDLCYHELAIGNFIVNFYVDLPVRLAIK